jgi:PBSX family phage terminase large subunit
MGAVTPTDAPIFEKLRTEVPFPQQIRFFKSDKKYTAYGGARGGGKSWAIRRKLVMLCMNYSNLKVLLVRRTFPELKANHIMPLLSDLGGYAKYKDIDKAFTFPNGSIIQLGYYDNDADFLRYQGQEYDVIAFDEATNFKEEWIKLLISSLRSPRSDFRERVYFTCNPGGASHNYIKRLFIDKKYFPDKGENPDDYEFISAKVTDNRILMENNPDYINQLKALPEKLRRAHLDGDWDIYDGQVFEEFRDKPDAYKSRRFTHVIEPFDIPEYGFNIYRSMDWGYSKPFSVNWYACDCDGRLYMIHEYYGCVGEPNTGVKMTPEEVFSEIAKIEREHPWFKGKDIRGVADPAIWNKETGISIAEVAESYGIYFDKGDNNRVGGLLQVHERLKFDENGIPMLYIFKTCRHTIRTLPLLQYDAHKVEDVDTSQEDHAYDSLRYMCNSRPIKAVVPAEQQRKPYNPLDDDISEYGDYNFYKSQY